MTGQVMPDWLVRHLEATGRRTRDGLTRKARARYCRTCGHLTVAGLAGDIAAVTAHCDLTPLSPLGEALAVIADRYTCSLRRAGAGLELDLRDSFHMATPAGTGPYDVLAQHVCGAPPLPSLPTNLALASPSKETTECPF